MLIGVDASRTTRARRTGTETYALHLIRALLDLGAGQRWRLYFNQAPVEGLFPRPAGTGVELRVMPFPRLWTHARLSWEITTRPPDLLFVPAHVLPLVHPSRSVATVHDLGYLYYPQAHTPFQNLYLRWSTRHNARAAARILADSRATRDDLIRHVGIPPVKIEVVYPGRDETLAPVTDPARLAEVRERCGLPATGRYLLYVGTLQPRKNLARLVQAFAAAAGRLNVAPSSRVDEPLYLVLAGQKGWLYGEIEAEVRRLGLERRVRFPGFVPREDLPALLSGALAFLFPSLYEGFGLPVLEAMSCGTPVICSDVSSLPEVAGDAALRVDPFDVDALAAAILRIVSDSRLRAALVGRGFRQIQAFSWSRAARQTLSIFEELCHAPR